jgi:cyanate permease
VGWLVLGALALAASVGAAIAARGATAPPPAPAGPQGTWERRPLAAIGAGYALFGAGYIAYATFIIAYLRHRGLDSTEVSIFWVVLGLASIAGAFAWPAILGRLVGGRGPAAVIAMVTIGAGVPLAFTGTPAAFASAALFGGSFLTVVTAVTELARRAVPAHALTAVIGTMTVTFALGQCAGPILAGVLSDGPDGVRAGLLLSVGILAAGSLISLAQPPRRGA